jgi:hypothetical protein
MPPTKFEVILQAIQIKYATEDASQQNKNGVVSITCQEHKKPLL